MNLARYRKAAVAVVGALVNVVALNVIPDPYQHWLVIAVSILTAVLVHQVPNDATAAPLPGEVKPFTSMATDPTAQGNTVPIAPPVQTGPTD